MRHVSGMGPIYSFSGRSSLGQLLISGYPVIELSWMPSTYLASDALLLTTTDSTTRIYIDYTDYKVVIVQGGSSVKLPRAISGWLPGVLSKLYIDASATYTRGWVLTGGVSQYLGASSALPANTSGNLWVSTAGNVKTQAVAPSWAFGAPVIQAASGAAFWLSAQNRMSIVAGAANSWEDQIGGVVNSGIYGAPSGNVVDATYAGRRTAQFRGSVLDGFAFSGFPTLTQPITVYIIGEGSGVTASRSTFYAATTGGTTVLWSSAAGADTFAIYSGTALGAINVPPFSKLVGQHNGTSSFIDVDGTRTVGASGGNGIQATVSIGSSIGTNGLKGKISEILFCSGAHSDVTIANVKAALASPYDNRKPKNIVCDGNSLTTGQNATGPVYYYPSVLGKLAQNAAYTTNVAVGGRATPAQIAALTANVYPLYNAAYQNIYIGWEGTNDLSIGAGSVSASQAYANLITLAQAVMSNGWQCVLGTVLPRQNAGLYAGFESDRLALNALLRSGASQYGYTLVDVGANTLLSDPTNATYYNATDKTHLTNAGYNIVARLFGSGVAQLTGGIL